MNKTIYMTYKDSPPYLVYTRWQILNPTYQLEFNLDADCVAFLKVNFNDYIANLFNIIPKGMYKADLWRLCKLYINGGVYADVDLVPYLDIDTLDKDVTFYSCLSICDHSIFQAFMVNFTKPKNALILLFLISFLHNDPYMYHNGPTYDMYKCVSYNLNCIDILPNKKYDIEEVKIHINIGRSDYNSKQIDLHFFPEDVTFYIRLCPNDHTDTFDFSLSATLLTVTRLDQPAGWEHHHSCDIIIKSNETLFFFPEKIEHHNDNSQTFCVTHNNIKILDSRDAMYANNGGW
jgi:hypothetical protein